MQSAGQGSSSVTMNKKNGEESEKSSTPQLNPTASGPKKFAKPRSLMDVSSESEDDDVSEVESFMIEQDADERLEGSKFLLSGSCADAVDPETQERLEALLHAAGIGRLGANDGKHLADPEVLRRLTSSVSCALDEAAAALTRMRTDRPPMDTRSLVEACSEGDVGTVKKLLTEGGKSVHETNEEGESLLSLACSAGYLELAQVLLAMNANVEDRGVKGDCTPLMEAASAGHVEIVALLLNHNAQVNAQSSSGNTALMYACAGGHEEVVKLLLECAANVEDHNENGHTPLMEAASAGHVGVAQILLNYGAGINTHSNEFKESALTLACYKGHLDMVRFLLDAGADQEHKTDEMHTALMEASMDGHVEVARLLLDSGAQVNMPTDSFESPLTLAACGGHTELALLLIERGANIEEVNDEGYTPLMEAAREGHEDMVGLLLAQGANLNAQTEETQETALTLACCGGFLEVADFLLKAGADLEAGASTPLMEASQEGHLDLVRYLLEYHHANVNAQTQSGDTALTYACENGHTDVASLLLLYGADLEHESEGGRTPLMKACRAGHTYTVQYLISKNADVNKTTTNNDHTPLSLAATGGHLAVVELLLGNRADPFHRLKDNSTMLIEAAKGGHTNVVHLLLDYPHSVMMQSTADSETRKVPGVAHEPEEPVPVPGPGPGPVPVPGSGPEPEPGPEPSAADPGPPCSPAQPAVTAPVTTAVTSPAATTTTTAIGTATATVTVTATATATATTTTSTTVPTTAPQTTPAPSAALGPQGQRSLLRKLRPLSTSEPGLTTAESQQVRSQPIGEPAAPEPDSEDKPDSPLPIVDACVQHGATQPFQVSKACCDLEQAEPRFYQPNTFQSTAISDRPKAKPFSKKDGKTLRKLLTQPMPPLHYDAAPTDTIAPVISPTLMQPVLTIPAPTQAAADSSDQDRLFIRANQQFDEEENLSQEAFNLLNPPQQDLAYITVPSIPGHPNQRSEGTLHVQYQYARALAQGDVDLRGFQITNAPIQFSGPSGQAITLTSEGGLQITNNGQLQMCASGQAKIEYPGSFGPGFQVTGSATVVQTPAPGVIPGLSLPSRLVGAAAYPPQLLLPSPPLSTTTTTTTTSQTFCCPNTPAPLEPPPARTQVQVATQTTNEKKGPPMQYAPLKQKKVRFQSAQRRTENFAQPDSTGSAQCPAVYPVPVGAPIPPVQLSSCMDVDSETDSNHDTALTLACAGGHEELVELLLSRGADIEHRDKKGFTPLILAATAGHEKVVEILLNHGADIEAQSERTKDTPLSLACSGGRYEVVELLLNKMANKEHRNVSDYTPLSLAASGGYVNIIKLLLNHGAEINSRTGSKLGISPLMLASMNGHVAAVKLLLDMGSDINAQIETNRNTALTLACFQGRHEVVSLLLDRKANVEHRAKTGLTPLMEAASGGYVDVGRVLIDKGADVNASPVPSSRDTALTIAADKGHGRFVELLLSRNAMVEVKNKKGNSPLWLAANGGHLAVVELLFNLGADIDSQDNRKVSCLVAALRKGHVKVIKWMVIHVTQFPSDQEMTRFIATIGDKELLDKCFECVRIIRAAKDLQSAKANKNATILLEELDMEKTREESKKAAAARKRERKKKKKLEKKEERRKMFEETQKPESEDEEEDGDNNGDGDLDTPEPQANDASNPERLGSTSPVADKEEGDSGIDANSQGSCSSNDVKSKDNGSKRKEKKKKKGEKCNDVNSAIATPPDVNERSNDRRVTEQTTVAEECSAPIKSTEKVSSIVNSYPTIQEREPQRHPAEREDFEATGNETYVPNNKTRKSNSNHQNHHEPEAATKTTSPKGAGKREEGWKEVVRNSSPRATSHNLYLNDEKSSKVYRCSFPYRSKKVSVPLNAISRVIGRGGSNINAIRTATGAHIEVEKQGKGQGERIITIKGSADATKQAHNLIGVLIKDPDVDIVQMLPKTAKALVGSVGTWEKPAVVTVAKTKVSSGKPVTAAATSPAVTGPVKQPSVIITAAKVIQKNPVVTQTGQALPLKAAQSSRVLSAEYLSGDLKRMVSSTKTTMSYTSAIMTAGKVTKPSLPCLPSAMTIAGPKPRAVIGPTMNPNIVSVVPPATAPVSPQVSPPQPMPSSPKHHSRPQPTSSAPPTMQQGQMLGKVVTAPSNLAQQNSQSTQCSVRQHPQAPPNSSQYLPFNYNLWNRNPDNQDAGKMNFASVAATGAPQSNKFVDEMPDLVDASKAPGYRGNSVCSPVSKHTSYISPNFSEPRGHDPSASPRGEPPVHASMGILPPMSLDVSAPVPGSIGQQQLFGPRNFQEPSMYSGDMMYKMQASPPPPAVAMSRLNPRAPDFAFGTKAGVAPRTRWAYGAGQPEIGYPNQSMNDLFHPYDNGLATSPTISPSSPIQCGLPSVDIKLEDRKIPRPIGTERNWKINGFDQTDQNWLDGKMWQAPNYRPSPTPTYRAIHDDVPLMDPSFPPAMNDYHGNSVLTQQMMMGHQVPIPPALDPNKLDSTGWDVEKHAYTEGWATTKWTH